MSRSLILILAFLVLTLYALATYYYPNELWFLTLDFEHKVRNARSFTIGLTIAVVVAIIQVLIINVLLNAIYTVSPVNRKFDPRLIWLLPAFWIGYIVSFYITIALARSFEREYQSFGNYPKEKPTYTTGMWANILGVAGALFYRMHDGTFAGLIYLVAIVFSVVYFIQIVQTTRTLKALQQQGPPFSFSLESSPDNEDKK